MTHSLENGSEDIQFTRNIEQLAFLLKLNGRRALVLTNSLKEVRKIRRHLRTEQIALEHSYNFYIRFPVPSQLQ